MNKNIGLGHLFLSIGAIIYGANHTIAKFAIPEYISPVAMVLCRNIGACLFFWTLSFFLRKPEKPQKTDYLKIFWAALFGIALNQLLFFIGLAITTPIYSGIIMTSSPIIVLVLSYFILKEKTFSRQWVGVALGILGVFVLLYFSKSAIEFQAPNPSLGNFYIFINACSYSIYLIISKPLLQKYHPIHFLKWIVTLGLVLQIPFAISDWLKVDWVAIPPKAWFSIFWVVVLISCVTYLLNLMALKRLKATTVSAYIFTQPLLAGLFALLLGKDAMDRYKIIGGILILLGVFLVSKSKKKEVLLDT